jgi:hypothetical protein
MLEGLVIILKRIIWQSFLRTRRHTVGILVGAFPCGVINIFDELYGSESLTQVYAIMIEYLSCLPTLTAKTD